jgi:endoglucanase
MHIHRFQAILAPEHKVHRLPDMPSGLILSPRSATDFGKLTICLGSLLGGLSLLFMSAHASAASYAQQAMTSFLPASGGSGTVVTITGSGFTGSNSAWVGNAHDATLKVISDSKVTVTVPADATTGAIGVLNPAHAAFTASSFTVGATSYPQQNITGFSPASGPKGTVVTISGSGFTGSSTAWLGSAHDAGLKVISDTRAQVTVPSDAQTGQIALLNAQHAAFAATAFTVASGTSSSSSSGSSSGGKPGSSSGSSSSGGKSSGGSSSGSNSSSSGGKSGSSSSGAANGGSSSGVATSSSSGGTLAVRVQGNQFVNAAGIPVQLRGVNYSGFEFVAIGGWDPSDPSGAQAGQAGGPNWAALNSWHVNTLRLPLNEASWLGYSCTDSSGVVHNPDPGGNYKAAVENQVAQANAAGIYVILDLHWAAPGTACPMLQAQMADADHSLAFWTSVAGQFKNNPAVLFELFNEPFLNFEFTGNAWTYMMSGTGGSFTGYPATSGTGNWQDVKQSWAIASYQQMINAVRAAGATNVVLVGTMQYSQDLSGWLANRPSDSQGQMAAAWHPYPTYGTTWGTPAYAQPNFAPGVLADVQSIRAAGIPVIATETGDQDSPGTVGAPLVSTVTQFVDQNDVSLIGWAWDVWGDASNVLITNVNGTPTDGYGVVYRSWLINHAP